MEESAILTNNRLSDKIHKNYDKNTVRIINLLKRKNLYNRIHIHITTKYNTI